MKCMYILVTYDVQTETSAGQKRLRKVARVCMNYGQRVQNSVFECVLTEVQLIELENELRNTIDVKTDNIRLYYLNHSGKHKAITIGESRSYDVEDVLLI